MVKLVKKNVCVNKVLSLFEVCFDLISSPSPSMKIQIKGGKITENLGFESPHRKVKKIVLILFIFKFSIKNCISLFLSIFEYLVLNQRYPVLCEEFKNEKKKGQTFRSGDSKPRFYFPTLDLNFHQR